MPELPGDDSAIPEVIEPANPLPPVALEDLPPLLREACERAGWSSLLPVQTKALPYLMKGRDLMTQSRTGSGKTGAFILPVLHRIDPGRRSCQAMVLVPTRELAQQITQEAEILSRGTGIHTVAVYGGVSYEPQIQAYREGAHLVVGTPGRILDHLLRGTLTLEDLQILIFDEADRMLSMGFYQDMLQVKTYLPRRTVNCYMFSATYPKHVISLAHEFMEKPEFLSLSKDKVHVSEVEHVYYVVPGMGKDRSLVRIIEEENPVSAIIFCNTKAKVRYVTIVLQRFGYNADELSSDLSQAARERVMGRLRSGSLRFLVATDVAARGIDIQDLSHVFLFEPPEDHEDYIHRAGRTGRVDAGGTAISLVADMEEISLQRIGKRYNIDFQVRSLPTEEELQELVAQRVMAMLEAKIRKRDKLQVERMRRFIPLAKHLGQVEGELQLLAMLLDDYYQETLHGPPVPVTAEGAPRKEPRQRTRPSRSRDRGGRSGSYRGGGSRGRDSRDSGRGRSGRDSRGRGGRRGPGGRGGGRRGR